MVEVNRAVIMALTVAATGLTACSKSGQSAAVHLGRRLVACWSPADALPGGARSFQGTLTGGVAVVSTKTGKTFSFDGTGGRVVVPNSGKLNFGANQDFSITAWIQPARAETSFGVMDIVDKRQVGGITAALGYAFHLENGSLACQLAPAGRWPWQFSDFTSVPRIKAWWQGRKQLVPMNFARFISSGPDLRDGKFHHVALTLQRRSSTGGKLFVDGKVVLVFDPTKQASSLVNRAPLLIGGHPDPTLNCGFLGQIGEVRLYSRAITSEEVEALCREPKDFIQ